MDGTYQPGEKQQEMQITVRFKVKHNPGNDGHLKMLLLSSIPVKGLPLREDEDGKLIMEV